MAEKYFGSWKRGNYQPAIEEEPKQTATRYVHIKQANYPPLLRLNYKGPAFTNNKENTEPAALAPSTHNTATWNEAILLGLSKSYKINSKWNGAIQVLWDVWWREKGMRSPIILRFATLSK